MLEEVKEENTPEQPAAIICENCTKPFPPTKRIKKYCSPKCKGSAAHKRFHKAHREELVQKSRDNYAEKKEKWAEYRENQKQKAENDPEYAERLKESKQEASRNYDKRNPGIDSFRNREARSKQGKAERLKPCNSKTLLAVARILLREAALTTDEKEKATIHSAALIMTVKGGAKILEETRTKGFYSDTRGKKAK